MFRRKREASFWPPASDAWWPVNAAGDTDPAGYDGYGEQAPALPDSDPFGGWPAFPAADPVDPVLGQPDPFAGRNPPGTAGPPSHPAGPPPHPAGPPPHSGRYPAFPAAGPSFPGGHPSFPGACPPPPPVPGHPAVHAPRKPTKPTAPAAPAAPARGRPATPPAEPDRGWTPLLTHAADGQPFQTHWDVGDVPDLADADPTSAADGLAGHPETRRVRAARRRRAARPAEGRILPATSAPAPAAAAARSVPVTASAPAFASAPTFAPVTRSAPAADPLSTTTWPNPVASPDPLEAASLAGAFAADYLSWDEAAQRRRGEVLAQYLPSDVVGSTDLLGWSGTGRQRAEFSLPGTVRPDDDGRMVVDVRVRVTPYAKVGVPAHPAPTEELEVAGVPAVAPAPTARGWKSMDSYWVRLSVPVIYDRGRLVIDVWEEQPEEDGEAPGHDTDIGDDSDSGDNSDSGDTATDDADTDDEAPRVGRGARDTQRDPRADQIPGGPQ